MSTRAISCVYRDENCPLNLEQPHRDRAPLSGADQHQGHQQFIPGRQSVDDKERGQGRRRKRHQDAPEIAPFGGAVQAGSFHEFRGDGAKEAAHDEYLEGQAEDHIGRHQRSQRARHAQLLHHHQHRRQHHMDGNRQAEQEKDEDPGRPWNCILASGNAANEATTMPSGTLTRIRIRLLRK